jgi:hypothetical protein
MDVNHEQARESCIKTRAFLTVVFSSLHTSVCLLNHINFYNNQFLNTIKLILNFIFINDKLINFFFINDK